MNEILQQISNNPLIIIVTQVATIIALIIAIVVPLLQKKRKLLGYNTRTTIVDINEKKELYAYFKDRCQVAFGIGTYLSNDCDKEPLNIVMKVTKCNGQDVAKISDTPGKGMCKNEEYVDYLRRSIDWRLVYD